MINIYFIIYFFCYLKIIDLIFTKTLTQYQIIIRNKMREPWKISFIHTHTHTLGHVHAYIGYSQLLCVYKQVFQITRSPLLPSQFRRQ